MWGGTAPPPPPPLAGTGVDDARARCVCVPLLARVARRAEADDAIGDRTADPGLAPLSKPRALSRSAVVNRAPVVGERVRDLLFAALTARKIAAASSNPQRGDIMALRVF